MNVSLQDDFKLAENECLDMEKWVNNCAVASSDGIL